MKNFPAAIVAMVAMIVIMLVTLCSIVTIQFSHIEKLRKTKQMVVRDCSSRIKTCNIAINTCMNELDEVKK